MDFDCPEDGCGHSSYSAVSIKFHSISEHETYYSVDEVIQYNKSIIEKLLDLIKF